jgi:hypothetical protein
MDAAMHIVASVTRLRFSSFLKFVQLADRPGSVTGKETMDFPLAGGCGRHCPDDPPP